MSKWNLKIFAMNAKKVGKLINQRLVFWTSEKQLAVAEVLQEYASALQSGDQLPLQSRPQNFPHPILRQPGFWMN